MQSGVGICFQEMSPSVEALPVSSASLSLSHSREMLVCISVVESLACEAEWIDSERAPPPTPMMKDPLSARECCCSSKFSARWRENWVLFTNWLCSPLMWALSRLLWLSHTGHKQCRANFWMPILDITKATEEILSFIQGEKVSMVLQCRTIQRQCRSIMGTWKNYFWRQCLTMYSCLELAI